LALAACILATLATTAAAHGFGARIDLPLPLRFWVVGAGATIVVSFVIVALFVREQHGALRYPRYDLLRVPPIRWLAHPIVVLVIRLVALFVFVVMIFAGLFGAQGPYANIIITLVWVIWWVGVAFICAVIGNLWQLTNPLNTVFLGAERLMGTADRPADPNFGMAYWPAVVLFFGFAWSELVWPGNSTPWKLAWAVIGYSVVTWVAMAVWGRTTWLRYGEAFTVAFGVLSRFAILEGPETGSRERALYLRPPGAGLLTDRPVATSYLVFVILMLSTVSYDGFLETRLFLTIVDSIYQWGPTNALLSSIANLGPGAQQVVLTVFLFLVPAAFLLIFLFTSWLMILITGARDLSTLTVARYFVLSLVPIAIAYHLSHYIWFLATTGQYIIPLLSDPFGYGWDLFGTADNRVNFGIMSPYVFWYAMVTAILIGHIVAVYLGHAVAMRAFGSRRAALLSQIPMLVLMVLYTMLSLWFLAQPIVE
jgi:hypothetical protein